MSKVAFPVYVYGTSGCSATHCKQAHRAIKQVKGPRNLSLRFSNFKISHHPKNICRVLVHDNLIRLQKLVEMMKAAKRSKQRTVRYSRISREIHRECNRLEGAYCTSIGSTIIPLDRENLISWHLGRHCQGQSDSTMRLMRSIETDSPGISLLLRQKNGHNARYRTFI